MDVEGSSESRAEAGIILVFPEQVDCRLLTNILNRTEFPIYRVRTCREAISFMDDHNLGVMISAAELPDGTWRDLLGQIWRYDEAPNLIIASRVADERLWADVLNSGGYDLLLVPFEPDEVLRITAQAWMDWHRKNTVTAQREAAGIPAGTFHPMVIARAKPDSRIERSGQKEIPSGMQARRSH